MTYIFSSPHFYLKKGKCSYSVKYILRNGYSYQKFCLYIKKRSVYLFILIIFMKRVMLNSWFIIGFLFFNTSMNHRYVTRCQLLFLRIPRIFFFFSVSLKALECSISNVLLLWFPWNAKVCSCLPFRNRIELRRHDAQYRVLLCIFYWYINHYM